MATKKTIAIPDSASGYYRVSLSSRFPHAGFDYSPAATNTVDRTVLDAMIAAGVVTNVVPG